MCMHVCMYVCIHVCIHMCVHVCIHMCACMCACMYGGQMLISGGWSSSFTVHLDLFWKYSLLLCPELTDWLDCLSTKRWKPAFLCPQCWDYRTEAPDKPLFLYHVQTLILDFMQAREPEKSITITVSSGSEWGHVNINAQCTGSQLPYSSHRPSTYKCSPQGIGSLRFNVAPPLPPVAMQPLSPPPSVVLWLSPSPQRLQLSLNRAAGRVVLPDQAYTRSPGAQRSLRLWERSPFPLPFSR